MTETINGSAAVALLALPDREFEEVVVADSKGEAGAVWNLALRSPEVVARWHDALISRLQDISTQLTHRAADLEAVHTECMAEGERGRQRYFAAKTEYDAWRKKAVYARAKTEATLREAKRVRHGISQAKSVDRRIVRATIFFKALSEIAAYRIPDDCDEDDAIQVINRLQDIAEAALAEADEATP